MSTRVSERLFPSDKQTPFSPAAPKVKVLRHNLVPMALRWGCSVKAVVLSPIVCAFLWLLVLLFVMRLGAKSIPRLVARRCGIGCI